MADYDRQRDTILETLRYRMPHSFLGYPTYCTVSDNHGVKLIQVINLIGNTSRRAALAALFM